MYHLIFKNGEIKDINDGQGQLLLKDWINGKDKFILDSSLRAFSSVSDIKPVLSDDGEYQKLPEIKLTPWTKEKKLNALRSMREGFLKGVSDRGSLKPNQSKMLENMDRLIFKAERAETTQKPITSFQEVYGGV